MVISSLNLFTAYQTDKKNVMYPSKSLLVETNLAISSNSYNGAVISKWHHTSMEDIFVVAGRVNKFYSFRKPVP